MLILNFIIHNVFTIDSNNLYVHGKLFYVYIIVSTVKTISIYSRTNNIYIKEKIFPLTLFIIAPTITSIIQNLFYGLSVNQIGFTLSSLLIFLYYQDKQISIDDLTKINNKKISVSIGYVSDKKIKFKNANSLIHAADELMYKAKKEK